MSDSDTREENKNLIGELNTVNEKLAKGESEEDEMPLEDAYATLGDEDLDKHYLAAKKESLKRKNQFKGLLYNEKLREQCTRSNNVTDAALIKAVAAKLELEKTKLKKGQTYTIKDAKGSGSVIEVKITNLTKENVTFESVTKIGLEDIAPDLPSIPLFNYSGSNDRTISRSEFLIMIGQVPKPFVAPHHEEPFSFSLLDSSGEYRATFRCIEIDLDALGNRGYDPIPKVSCEVVFEDSTSVFHPVPTTKKEAQEMLSFYLLHNQIPTDVLLSQADFYKLAGLATKTPAGDSEVAAQYRIPTPDTDAKIEAAMELHAIETMKAQLGEPEAKEEE